METDGYSASLLFRRHVAAAAAASSSSSSSSTATKKKRKKPPTQPLLEDDTTTFTVEEERAQLRGMQAALKDTHYLVTVDPNRANLFFAVDNDGNKAELKNSRYNNTMTKLSSYQRWLNRT